MFTTIKQVFQPKNKDLLKRLLFTLFGLIIYKIGTAIVVPGIDRARLGTDNLGFLELINVMGGGALERFSIFALGVMPYITASIIIQLLQMDIVPYLAELAKQGHTGRMKTNQITRILGIILAFIQGYMMSFAFIKGGTVWSYMQFATVLTAGTAFTLWLGDQITAKGIGNGISLIIMAGIIASLPKMFVDAWSGLVDASNTQGLFLGITMFTLFVLVYLTIIIGIIYVESAERRIPIQYANKSTASLGRQTYMPFKLNSAGVVPVIFSSALISIPTLLARFIKNDQFSLFISKWLSMNTITGFILYIAFIIAFCYFYTYLQLKPKEMADNLQKNGGYIPGIRPGKETIDYVSRILNRITIVGAIFLAVIAGLPIVFGIFSSLPTSVSIGGTGLLIIVGVALETYKQLESQLVARTYTTTHSSRRKRG
ncbi:MAG: preprotein translocase subunit SecY [Mollicutes bacterium]|nr:preprotein translocase subunit SecY [Mollicutes bacterium]